MSQMQRISKNNTRVVKENGLLKSVQLHNTIILVIESDGSITLNTGGYKSVTTKARMNQASNEYNLHFTVYQEKNEWFVGIHEDQRYFARIITFNGNQVNFKVDAN